MNEISQYREQKNKEGVNWTTGIAMALFHIGAIALADVLQSDHRALSETPLTRRRAAPLWRARVT